MLDTNARRFKVLVGFYTGIDSWSVLETYHHTPISVIALFSLTNSRLYVIVIPLYNLTLRYGSCGVNRNRLSY